MWSERRLAVAECRATTLLQPCRVLQFNVATMSRARRQQCCHSKNGTWQRRCHNVNVFVGHTTFFWSIWERFTEKKKCLTTPHSPIPKYCFVAPGQVAQQWHKITEKILHSHIIRQCSESNSKSEICPKMSRNHQVKREKQLIYCISFDPDVGVCCPEATN